MNANELADKWGLSLVKGTHGLFDDLDTMLRQQQAEIEALKAKFKAKTEGWLDSIRADAEFYNSRDKKQKAKIKKLKHDIGEYVRINTELATENMALRKEIEALNCELNLHKAKDIVSEQRQDLVDLGVIIKEK